MKIIVAGAGDVGTHLTKMLAAENHVIVVIEPDEDKLNYLTSHYDIMAINGSAASIQVLKDAGIKKTDLFIAVTSTQELNVMASILGKRLGARKTIARIDDNEFLLPMNKKYFIDLGIDSFIYPQRLAANEVINLLNKTGTTEVVDFTGGALSLYVIKLEENAPIVGKSLIDANELDRDFNYRAVAISRKGGTIIPKGSDVFKVNDLVHVITKKSGVDKLMRFAGKENFTVKNIMILGGSRTGKRIARKLEHQYKIKLIEIDKEKAFKLSDILDNTLIINGDGRNQELLLEEGIKDMDAFIAVTENSETNILSCLAAKEFGVKKTIAEIENIDYMDLAETIGINTFINKKLIAASHIYAFTLKTDVQSFKCLTGTDADVLEYIVKPGAKVTKKIVRKLDFPKSAIIGGVVRGNQAFIVHGNTQIMENDLVVVFSLPCDVPNIQKFFS